MNTARISNAVREIERNTAALKWLEEYGVKLSMEPETSLGISVSPHFAGSCTGAKEASEVLTAFACRSIAELVETAIKNCRNTIEIHRQAIIDEAGRALEGQP
ncbi:hypothetical protein JYP46_01290 [Nitratireductor aquimarinus]|uniref:hypothetical protein n=1 Tax=Alphaproteobacteria TaxID=28211 RepID=UPI0019D37B9C|nr:MULTISPECIES: hypothetical protein [Alphaproteobacteria]MBN7755444.1 hypothetical protein [Nitratireductor aquimarinus]MBY5998199.1 hypothetical protein [Tritonibacter mobilis]MBY6020226.1 hypothetical protein [Nitratireductor sp. DP7N14-4]